MWKPGGKSILKQALFNLGGLLQPLKNGVCFCLWKLWRTVFVWNSKILLWNFVVCNKLVFTINNTGLAGKFVCCGIWDEYLVHWKIYSKRLLSCIMKLITFIKNVHLWMNTLDRKIKLCTYKNNTQTYYKETNYLLYFNGVYRFFILCLIILKHSELHFSTF